VEASSDLVTTRKFRAWSVLDVYGNDYVCRRIAMPLASDWILVLVVAAALILHFEVVKREERYLKRKFGESYRDYMRIVPRYWV
jgi:protein-S-isoprenylcysteine O-methyltransferase Ste14